MRKWRHAAMWLVVVALAFSFAVCQKKVEEAKKDEPPKEAAISEAPMEEAKKEVKEEAESMDKEMEKMTEKAEEKTKEMPVKVEEAAKELMPEDALAIIELEKGGKIVFKFYPKDAPNSVDNFIKLAKKGFYDGLDFHRVIAGFMAQGGRPKGAPTARVKAEFNSQKHIEGTVAMARANDPNSATSQFYICFEPQPHLDGNYTVFGQVIDGMDIVHTIQQGDVMKKVTIVDKASVELSSE